MPADIAYRHITKPDDGPAQLDRLPRIRVADIVLPHLVHGWSADELRRQFPHLTLGEIHACLGYYFDNQAEVDAAIAGDQVLNTELAARFQKGSLAARLRAQKQ